MFNESIIYIVITILATFLMPPILTCVVETPIIRKFLGLKNVLYICAVNVLTNVSFNFIGIICFALNKPLYYVYLVICEALIIPLGEALLFMLLVDDKKKCVLASYFSNASSFVIGLAVNFVLKKFNVL